MIGVNFQPGSQGYGQNGNGNGGSPPAGSGVQEAIKILSLRLPKVVGAQAAVPMPLLTSQGGGGRVDSVVNQILSRMGQSQSVPQLGGGMGDTSGTMPVGQPQPFDWNPSPDPRPSPPPATPRVVIGNPPTWGTDADLSGGGMGPGGPPGIVLPPPTVPGSPEAPSSDPAPNMLEELRRMLEAMNAPQGYGGGGYDPPLL